MKKLFTLIILTSLAAISYGQALKIFWGGPGKPESEFAGGFNGWTTEGLASADDSKKDSAIWKWVSTADARGGAYYNAANQGPIQSISPGNGAMVFNSDRYDNGGVVGNFGNGVCPAPHVGVLTSPTIDCSTQNSVAVYFYQYYRNFQSSSIVEVSADGGVTWDQYIVNASVAVNAATPRNSRILVDVSNTAANQANVKIRFKFDGNYYFWVIDDVYLVNLPANDIAITTPFYTPGSFQQPKAQMCNDSFVIQTGIANLGGEAQTNVVVAGYVIDAGGRIMWGDSTVLDRLETTDDDTTVTCPNLWSPGGLDFGDYTIRWRVYSKDQTELIPANNTRSIGFRVTEDTYSKVNATARGGIRAGGGGAYYWGAQYRTSNCWGNGVSYDAISSKCNLAADDVLNGYTFTLWLLRVKDGIDEDFNGCDLANGIESDCFETVGYGFYECTTEADYEELTVELLDANTDELGVRLKPNSRYFLMASHGATVGTNDIFMGSNSALFNGFTTPGLSTPVIDDGGTWFNGFNGNPVPYLEMNTVIVLGTDDTPLAESTLSIRPNPVTIDQLTAVVNFEQATDAHVVIAAVDGSVMTTRDLKSVGSQELKFDVSKYPAGNYFIRLSTQEGSRTMKFVVAK